MTRRNPIDVVAERPLPEFSPLDETRGVLCYGATDVADLDPKKRVTLPELTLMLGNCLGERPEGVDQYADPVVGVTKADVERISTRSLERGVYIYAADSRYWSGEQLISTVEASVVARARRSNYRKLPFEPAFKGQPAVVFNSGDYSALMGSPARLAAQVMSITHTNHKGNTNVEEVDRRAHSAASQAIEGKIEKAVVIRDRYFAERQLIESLYKQAQLKSRGIPYNAQNLYQAQNLAPKMRQFDHLFFAFLDTAALNNGWSGHELHAAKKASIAERYRAVSPEAASEAWRRQLAIYGLYNNARLFKVAQVVEQAKRVQAPHRKYERKVIAGDQAAAA